MSVQQVPAGFNPEEEGNFEDVCSLLLSLLIPALRIRQRLHGMQGAPIVESYVTDTCAFSAF